jgi:transposase
VQHPVARSAGTEKLKPQQLAGEDTAALLALLASLGIRTATDDGAATDIVGGFEAGRDGFWLQRLLTAHGIATCVLKPSSILVNRHAKTDRLDALSMLYVLDV